MLTIFSTYVTSIFLEGIFFLLAGVFISSLIEVFVPKEFIEQIVPSSRVLGVVVSSFTGILFPVCECGIVPVVARLIKKGVPVSNALTMMLSIPIVNIVVFSSTHFAFINRPGIALYRMAGGVLISSAIGLITGFFISDDFILKSGNDKRPAETLCKGDSVPHDCHCGCSGHDHLYGHNNSEKLIKKIGDTLSHSILEFFDTGKYFITGVLVTSAFQTFIPRSYFNSVGKTYPVSELFMMGYAFILSICSQTDAFIARSFSDNFSAGALLCFMISGAMIDIKTTSMLKNIFSTKFIFVLIVMIAAFTLIFSFCAELIMGMGL